MYEGKRMGGRRLSREVIRAICCVAEHRKSYKISLVFRKEDDEEKKKCFIFFDSWLLW